MIYNSWSATHTQLSFAETVHNNYTKHGCCWRKKSEPCWIEILYSNLKSYPECRSSSSYKTVATQPVAKTALQALRILQEQLWYSRHEKQIGGDLISLQISPIQKNRLKMKVIEKKDCSELNQVKKGEQKNKLQHKLPWSLLILRYQRPV